ncbi:cobalamin biosynthesis protein [Anaerobutyricum hallii]|nr:cobalamin biosynthesis protein [Anaerobutyricum hallii]
MILLQKKYDMAIENIGQLKHISGALLAGKKVNVFTNKNAKKLYPELAEEQKRGMINIFSLSDFFKIYIRNKNNTKTEDLNANLRSKNIITSHIETYNIAVTDDKNVKTTPIMSPSTNIDNIESNIPIVVIDEGFSLNECSTIPSSAPILYLRPRTICAGIGCKRNMEQQPIEEALLQTLKEEGIHPLSLKCIATIPLKSDEPGIIGTAVNLNVPLKIIPTEKIEKLDISQLGIATSEFVASQTGVLSVSTACSYLASGKGEILRDKAKYKGITIALSKEKS